MIKTQLLTPEVYYKESRDFQFFGRLYDIIFNYLKTEIDLIRSFPNNNTQDTKFLELILKTLNFRNLREYQLDQLHYLINEWVYIIQNKGSKEAVDKAIRLILRMENIKEDYELEYDTVSYDIPIILIQIKNMVSSQESSLLEEILNYILPIGVGYIIQNVALLNDITPMSIKLEEHTSLREVKRKQLGSLAKSKGEKIESDENNPIIKDVYTGTFEKEYFGEEYGDDKVDRSRLDKGSIRVETLIDKKE